MNKKELQKLFKGFIKNAVVGTLINVIVAIIKLVILHTYLS